MKNICAILIFALLLSITPYDYLLSKADSIAHATPELPDSTLKNQFDVKNSAWEWQHEDQDGGRWVVINTINYYDAAGAKTTHTMKYAQQAADGDTTLSALDVSNKENRTKGGYWFKIDKYDSVSVTDNYYLYIYTYDAEAFKPDGFDPFNAATRSEAFRVSFQEPNLAEAKYTAEKKVYGLYYHEQTANPSLNNKLLDDAIICESRPYKVDYVTTDKFSQLVLIPDIKGTVIPYSHKLDWLWTSMFGTLSSTYTNANVKGKCVRKVGTKDVSQYHITGTGTPYPYLTAVSNYLNNLTENLNNNPNVTEATLTAAETTVCKDLLIGGPDQAKKTFIEGYSKFVKAIMNNAVDNANVPYTVPPDQIAQIDSVVQKAFDGKLNTKNTIFSETNDTAGIDFNTLYTQYYGGYGVVQKQIANYPTVPSTVYPNQYFDKNMREADRATSLGLEQFHQVKPENSLRDKEANKMDLEKSMAKAAKAAAKAEGKNDLLGGLERIEKNLTTGITIGTSLVVLFFIYKLFSPAINSFVTSIISEIAFWAVGAKLTASAWLTGVFGSITFAVVAISVILVAITAGIVVFVMGREMLKEYWSNQYTRQYISSMFSWWLGTQALVFQKCMLDKSVGKGSLSAAKAAKIGLTQANLDNSTEMLALTRADLAKMTSTVAGGIEEDTSCGCGDVTNTNIMNLIKRSFCAVICWTFNVGKGMQENATCLFNSALGTIGRSEDKKPRLSSAACKKP